MPLQDIWQRIESRYDTFSPQLQRAARFVREHPQIVALESLRAVSREAGVSPTSMTRFLQALQFDNYDAFQAEHRLWLTSGRQGVFSEKADRLISGVRAPGAQDALLNSISEAERANIFAGLAPQARAPLKAAAAILAEAPSLTIVGIRSCFPVAFSLHYSLSLFMPGVRLVMGTGGSLLDDVHQLHEGDAMVVISVAPYSRETVEVASHAQRNKARIVAITDGNLTPIARLAEVTLVASNDSPAHIASPIGPLAVAQALAILVLAQAGEDALEALRRREATFEATSAYLPEEKT